MARRKYGGWLGPSFGCPFFFTAALSRSSNASLLLPGTQKSLAIAVPFEKDWVDKFILDLRTRKPVANLGVVGPACEEGAK